MLVLAKPSIHTAPLRNARKKSAYTRLGSHRSPRFDSIPYSFRTDAERKAEPTQSDTVPYTHGVAISNMSRAPRARQLRPGRPVSAGWWSPKSGSTAEHRRFGFACVSRRGVIDAASETNDEFPGQQSRLQTHDQTWCSCWPYGIAPRAEVNFSAPCAEPEVDGRTMANPGFFCQPRVLLSTSFVQLLSGESS